MSTNPYYVVTEDNPNEIFGSRACSFAGQQKSADCAGVWRTWHTVPVGRPAPRLTICDFHLQAAANDGHGAAKPTKQAKRKPRVVEEELSL